jgi:hypothetical protein
MNRFNGNFRKGRKKTLSANEHFCLSNRTLRTDFFRTFEMLNVNK